MHCCILLVGPNTLERCIHVCLRNRRSSDVYGAPKESLDFGQVCPCPLGLLFHLRGSFLFLCTCCSQSHHPAHERLATPLPLPLPASPSLFPSLANLARLLPNRYKVVLQCWSKKFVESKHKQIANMTSQLCLDHTFGMQASGHVF